LCEQLGVRLRILAEVDDMATLRLLARDTDALALVPTVVVRDELRDGALHEQCRVPGLFENFYAITAERMFQHPLVAEALARDERELLESGPPRPPRRSDTDIGATRAAIARLRAAAR
jgi:LysR family transcriptional regulator, transcriptional activator of nhaA